MLLRCVSLLWLVSSMARWSWGQSAECELDSQCQTGSYCVPVLFVCRSCLHCDLLHREPPPVAKDCVKSVAECGPCIRGLVDEVRGDVTDCVPAESAGSFPVWAAGALALGLALFVAGAALVYYMLRNNLFNVMSIKTLTSTSVSPSAPEQPQPPPPYYTVPYTNIDHRPQEYSHYPGRYHRTDGHGLEHGHASDSEGDALMEYKKTRPEAGDESTHTRGTDGRQAATPYNNPDYVRVPPAEESTGSAEPAPSARALTPIDPDHDEDTVQSTWTPGQSKTHHSSDSGPGGMELSELLSAARRSTLLRDPRACTQETNNGRNTSSSGAGGEGGLGGLSGAGGAGMQAFFINIQQNMFPEAPRSQVNDPGTKLSL
ncbi:hypothetical protein KGM_211863 [Danaus plexippus plexippus]|uniref:Uncharacterized protein n=1 Tax=Danaus plexippus plexippus TaxID=278856 RepID=A0A212EMC3_DANPL|nr:hypothetical protein KGM_211863 [Danaus plexippus plexippus]